jgi:hypothetical protein
VCVCVSVREGGNGGAYNVFSPRVQLALILTSCTQLRRVEGSQWTQSCSSCCALQAEVSQWKVVNGLKAVQWKVVNGLKAVQWKVVNGLKAETLLANCVLRSTEAE